MRQKNIVRRFYARSFCQGYIQMSLTSAFVSPTPIRQNYSHVTTKFVCKKRSRGSQACLAQSFEKAVSQGFVKDFGRIVKLDKNGCLPQRNDLCIPNIWALPLNHVTHEILSLCGRLNSVAIFVRGSLVTGNYFEDGSSDLDLIVFTRDQISKSKRAVIRERVMSTLQASISLSGIDIMYIHQEQVFLLRRQFNISPTLLVTVQQYSLPLYGSVNDIGITDDPKKPSPYLCINIRRDEQMFNQCLKSTETFSIQLDTIQWLCKRCLRAVTELSSQKARAHCRDLVPCFRISSKAYPLFTKTLLYALQIACASPRNNFLGLDRQELLSQGMKVVQNLVEIVEDLSLHHFFGVSQIRLTESVAPHYASFAPSETFLDKISQKFGYGVSRLVTRPNPSLLNLSFSQTELPVLLIQPQQAVDETLWSRQKKSFNTVEPTIASFLSKEIQPHIYRNVLRGNQSSKRETVSILTSVIKNNKVVQCRISPRNDIMFCRSTHQWIKSKSFSPPSVSLPLRPEEAILRLSKDCQLPPLYYLKSDKEYIYIQTNVQQRETLFDVSEKNDLQVVQQERLWASAHGTVSHLHYDASHSALLQRSGMKRMLFFPPHCLQYIGIYPLGHPLHRRARVNLGRRDTKIFERFWKVCASEVIEAVVWPGDLILFPPFWAHYTESITEANDELSISHTLRFM